MKLNKKVYVVLLLLFLLALIALAVSLWSLLWFFSSSSLASGFCKNEFSLFHESFRCRQPYIAIIAFLFSFATFAKTFMLGCRKWKE